MSGLEGQPLVGVGREPGEQVVEHHEHLPRLPLGRRREMVDDPLLQVGPVLVAWSACGGVVVWARVSVV
jgi:hypothetical protein